MTDAQVLGLVEILANGIRVFVQRGIADLTEDQIYDRARNQAQAILGNYFIVPLPDGVPVRRLDFDTPLISHPQEFPAKPLGHGWSCKCDRCDTFNRSVRQ